MSREFRSDESRTRNFSDLSDDLIYENILQSENSNENEQFWNYSRVYIISNSDDESFEDNSIQNLSDSSSSNNIQICDEIDHSDSLSNNYQSDSLSVYESSIDSIDVYSDLEIGFDDLHSSSESSSIYSQESDCPIYTLSHSNPSVNNLNFRTLF